MLARAGCGGRIFDASRPWRKVKDLEMPITCTLFANSAADWNMQLAATRVGKEKRCSGGSGLLKYNPASAVRAEAPPCGGSQNSPRWLRHENICATSIKTRRLRIAKTAEPQKPAQKTPDKTNNSLYPPRHYAASGLLNLQTTLVRTMIRTTPGVKLLSHEDRASRSQKQMNFAFSAR